jgi:hypothetical protein
MTRTSIPAFWNSPICWRDDGLLCVQATNDAQVWAAFWPALPSAPAIRQGAGTGLAQWVNPLSLMTWDELGVTTQPVYLVNAVVAQANQGGVLASLGMTTGVLDRGTITNNPRPALAADGSLSFVYWSQDGHGATQTVLYQGVTAADLKPAPPPDYPVTPLTKPTLFGVFDKVMWPLWANARTQDVGYPMTGLYGLDAQGRTVEWNVYDIESQTGNRTSPCCYNGSVDSLLMQTWTKSPADIVSPWIYPEPSETPPQFLAKAQMALYLMAADYPGVPVAPVWRVDTRIGPNGPTLTEDQVLHCLSIASSFGLPALFFQGDRAGFVQAAVPMLEKWRNGQPCSVPVQPVPPSPKQTIYRSAPMPYPPLAGFRKTQFSTDPSNSAYLNCKVENPIAVAYDGGPPIGTVLNNARTGQPMPHGQAFLCLDRSGNWLGMPTETVGIGWFGFWKIGGSLAFICPRNQDGTNDETFAYVVSD